MKGFDFAFGFFSYLIDWFGLSGASTADGPGESNISAMPIGGRS